MLLDGIPHAIAYSIDQIPAGDPNRSFLTCPLSGSLMKNPVIASDGVTYDYGAIIRLYLKEKHPQSPTQQGAVLADVCTLRPNWEARKRLMRMVNQLN